MQEQAEKIRLLEEQVKALSASQVASGNAAALALQPVASGLVQNAVLQTKETNTRYGAHSQNQASAPPTAGANMADNKENALYQSSNLLVTPIHQKSSVHAHSAQYGKGSIYQDEMHVDHSNKNQNSNESHHHMQSATAHANNSVKSVIHHDGGQVGKRDEQNQDGENAVPGAGSVVAGMLSSINSSQCSDGFMQQQNLASDYQVFKEINNLNDYLKRSKSQTAGGRSRPTASGGAPPLIPNLDLSRVLPNFSKKQQEDQLKQYKLI